MLFDSTLSHFFKLQFSLEVLYLYCEHIFDFVFSTLNSPKPTHPRTFPLKYSYLLRQSQNCDSEYLKNFQNSVLLLLAAARQLK